MNTHFLNAFQEVKALTKDQYDHCIACCRQDNEEFEIVVENAKHIIVIKRSFSSHN